LLKLDPPQLPRPNHLSVAERSIAQVCRLAKPNRSHLLLRPNHPPVAEWKERRILIG
jgi:hypothetical protein